MRSTAPFDVESTFAVIVPKGTWHTARTTVPPQMPLVTPGAGTQNRPVA